MSRASWRSIRPDEDRRRDQNRRHLHEPREAVLRSETLKDERRRAEREPDDRFAPFHRAPPAGPSASSRKPATSREPVVAAPENQCRYAHRRFDPIQSGRIRSRGRDLAVTTDFRDVFAEVLAKRLAIGNLKPVFPGYGCDDRKRLGIIA